MRTRFFVSFSLIVMLLGPAALHAGKEELGIELLGLLKSNQATFEKVSRLIEGGAELSLRYKDDQSMPLHWAAKYAPKEVVALILETIIRRKQEHLFYARDRQNRTPLHWAYAAQRSEIATYLAGEMLGKHQVDNEGLLAVLLAVSGLDPDSACTELQQKEYLNRYIEQGNNAGITQIQLHHTQVIQGRMDKLEKRMVTLETGKSDSDGDTDAKRFSGLKPWEKRAVIMGHSCAVGMLISGLIWCIYYWNSQPHA